MPVLRRPSDFVSEYFENNQYNATTGKRFFPDKGYGAREEWVENLADSYLPGVKQAEYERSIIDKEQALRDRDYKAARRDATVSTGLNLARLGYETGLFDKGKSLLRRDTKPTFNYNTKGYFSPLRSGADAGQKVVPATTDTAGTLSEEVGSAATKVLPGAGATAPPAEGLFHITPKGAVGAAGIGYTAGKGYKYLADRTGLTTELRKAGVSKKASRTIGGGLTGAGVGFATGGPPGALVGFVTGLFGGRF